MFGTGEARPGRIAEAIELLETDALRSANPQARGFLGYAYARAGRRADAEKLAAAGDQPNANALIFAGLQDKERTVEALRQMAALGPQRVGRYLQYPELAFLKHDSRLILLRRSIGLPEV